MWVFIGHLVIAVVAGTSGGVVGALLAFRRFRRERWWDRKVQAYEAIIEALHHVMHFVAPSAYGPEGWQPGKGSHEDTRRACDAIDTLAKARDMSSFLLCQEATEALDAHCDKLAPIAERLYRGKATPAREWCRPLYDATQECLSKIKTIGKRDLRVK